MASTSMSDTHNTSGFNTSNMEQKMEYHKMLDKLSLLDNDSLDIKKRVDCTMQVLDDTKTMASAATSNTSMALLDSYVLRQVGQQALNVVRNIEVNTNVYNSDELAQHIRENPSWWEFCLPRQVASAATLHGAFDPAPPPQRARAPRRRHDPQRNVALRQPDNIASLVTSQVDTSMLSKILRVIKDACRRGPLSYFHCVLDPDSFARSVHNIFYISFLVRDGKVAIYVDEQHGIPMIRPVAGEQQRVERDISTEKQFIVSINKKRWGKLVHYCGIKKPMMTW